MVSSYICQKWKFLSLYLSAAGEASWLLMFNELMIGFGII